MLMLQHQIHGGRQTAPARRKRWPPTAKPVQTPTTVPTHAHCRLRQVPELLHVVLVPLEVLTDDQILNPAITTRSSGRVTAYTTGNVYNSAQHVSVANRQGIGFVGKTVVWPRIGSGQE